MSEFRKFKNPIYDPSSNYNGVPDVIILWVDSIEIAALEQAEAKIKELEAKLSIAVEALEFYGNENSWITTAENEFSKIKRTIVKKENDCESFGYQASPEDKNIVVTIAGNLARQALEKLRGVV